ncbi:Crp/Fnr family transcriptional regulator [Shivajiella indica]|uniref:Crp/Fnr family transcriptional regulator n=1 Tax=Shivajiella indica TaxID=872115 RepID=A0ABW5BBH2_9BACT
MVLYKRRLQLRLYMLNSQLPLDPLARFMMEYAVPLDFKKNEKIKSPGNKEAFFFINKGMVTAFDTQLSNSPYLRLLGPNNLFVSLNSNSPFTQLSWQALSPSKLLYIPYIPIKNNLAPFYLQWEKLIQHIQEIEKERMHHHSILNALKNNEKLDYLEKNLPKILIKSNYGTIARFIGISRETLVRLISKKNHMPIIF